LKEQAKVMPALVRAIREGLSDGEVLGLLSREQAPNYTPHPVPAKPGRHYPGKIKNL
jgi:hypothetical protein